MGNVFIFYSFWQILIFHSNINCGRTFILLASLHFVLISSFMDTSTWVFFSSFDSCLLFFFSFFGKQALIKSIKHWPQSLMRHKISVMVTIVIGLKLFLIFDPKLICSNIQSKNDLFKFKNYFKLTTMVTITEIICLVTDIGQSIIDFMSACFKKKIRKRKRKNQMKSKTLK